jgi:hypothetical protein
MQKRQLGSERVTVDLPITLAVEDETGQNQLYSEGRVNDLSINGMRVHVPLPFGMLEEELLDFNLELPNPFGKIKGTGKVQWKRWDENKNRMICGLKLEPMTLKQLADLDAIVSEVAEEK